MKKLYLLIDFHVVDAVLNVRLDIIVLCIKWRLLYKSIEPKIVKAENIVKAIILMHNIIIDLDGSPYAIAI